MSVLSNPSTHRAATAPSAPAGVRYPLERPRLRLVRENAGEASAPRRNPKAVGMIAEVRVLARLVEAGYDVLQPYGDNSRYDLAIDTGTALVRIQVKTGRLVDGAVAFEAASSQVHRGRGRRHYRGQADIFAVYCPATDEVYYVPVEECGLTQARLRLSPSRNGQAKGVRWASDYTTFPLCFGTIPR